MPDPTPSADEAIQAALLHNWKDAIHINSLLVKQNTQDIESYNRLGFAYMQSGQLTLSKRSFLKVLTLDPYNHIAEKNLKRLGHLKKRDVTSKTPAIGLPLSFIEEPGKTKIVSCLNVAPNSVMSILTSGQEVFLKPKRHCVEIRTSDDVYVAALPDDLSFKLIKLLEGGNKYQVFIKSVAKNSLIVFVREISRGNRFMNQPSFIPASSQYAPSVVVPDASTTAEEPSSDQEGEDSA